MREIILIVISLFLSIIPLNAKEKYLIITSDRFYQSDALNNFMEYRGNDFDVEVVINSEIGSQVEQYIDFIKNNKPKYILLVGNYYDFPSRTIPYLKPVESYNYWVAEQVDSLFQIKIPLGLFFVENEAELENIISKTIKFEHNLEVIPKKLYTHSGSIEPLEPWPLQFNDELLNEMNDSFFKKNAYIHQHETSLDNTPNDALRDAEAINKEVKYIIYHGHGNIQKWSFGMGVQGINFLTNDEYFPIIFSASCLTGTFTGKIDTNEYDCFAEKMLSSPNGAVAFIGAFNESGRGQNPLLYGFSKAVNDIKNIRLGDALLYAYNNIELPETVKKYYPIVTMPEFNRARLQFHLFGDPALLINKEPTNILDKVNFNEMAISPNPASEYIEINLDRCATLSKCGTSKNVDIKIFNTFGELVISDVLHLGDVGHLKRIDISDLSVGLYFVYLSGKVIKFVKI